MSRVTSWLRTRSLLAAGGAVTIIASTLLTGLAQDTYRGLKERFFDQPCSISGKIFETDSNRPLSGVQVSLYQEVTNSRPREVRPRVATTGPDGAFKASCKGIDSAKFPLVLQLWHPRWNAHLLTGPQFAASGDWNDVNLAVDVSTLLKRRPLPVALDAGPIGVVVRANTIGDSPAYDFRTKTFHR